MKVKELLKELKDVDPEMTVVIETDHGQTPMKVAAICHGHVSSLEDYYLDYTVDFEGVKVLVLSD